MRAILMALALFGGVALAAYTSPCNFCDGTGLSKQVCTNCNGVGHKNGQRCGMCKGYGYPPCIACGGDGQVSP